MSSKTKIVVLHMKEIIYTVIFVLLGIILILLLFFMFFPKDKKTTDPSKEYMPGIYTDQISIGNTTFQMEVTVEKDCICSIRCVNLNDSVAAMYPLLQPAIENMADQVCEKQSTKDVLYPKENPYTSKMIIQSIERSLKKAEVKR